MSSLQEIWNEDESELKIYYNEISGEDWDNKNIGYIKAYIAYFNNRVGLIESEKDKQIIENSEFMKICIQNPNSSILQIIKMVQENSTKYTGGVLKYFKSKQSVSQNPISPPSPKFLLKSPFSSESSERLSPQIRLEPQSRLLRKDEYDYNSFIKLSDEDIKKEISEYLVKRASYNPEQIKKYFKTKNKYQNNRFLYGILKSQGRLRIRLGDEQKFHLLFTPPPSRSPSPSRVIERSPSRSPSPSRVIEKSSTIPRSPVSSFRPSGSSHTESSPRSPVSSFRPSGSPPPISSLRSPSPSSRSSPISSLRS